MDDGYVHGYSPDEADRLGDQADTLAGLLYKDVHYPAGCRVLEPGCGTCSQTIHLAPASPDAEFYSIDISASSLKTGAEKLDHVGITNVRLEQQSLFDLPYEDGSFDHVFVCFVLEHVSDPVLALRCLRRVLKPHGTLTVIEGDHGSAYYHPMSRDAQATIDCLIECQSATGGDPLIGRRLFPLLNSAGFASIEVSPVAIYADSSRPHMVDGFTRKTFIAMVEGVKAQAIARGLITESRWEKGISDLKKTAGAEGTFNYTFFRGQCKNT